MQHILIHRSSCYTLVALIFPPSLLPGFPTSPILLYIRFEFYLTSYYIFPLSHLNQHKYIFLVFVFFFCLFRAAPAAYGGSQAGGLIGPVATSLHHSHSNTGSELHLRPIPQLTGNAGSSTH